MTSFSFLCSPIPLAAVPSLKWRSKAVIGKRLSFSSPISLSGRGSGGGVRVKAFFFNPTEEPILKEALKEPVAFMGGMFAGLLRLDLNEDPLREWVARTVEASGITEEEINTVGSKSEEVPEQIEIE